MRKYSQEFIEQIKKVYPESEEILKLAQEGNPFVGRYLDDSRSMFPYKTIYKFFTPGEKYDEEKFGCIVKLINAEHEKLELYRLWGREVDNYRSSNDDSKDFVYSDDFRAKVIEVYPDWEDALSALNRNSYFLGRYLDDNSTSTYEWLYKVINDSTKKPEETFDEMMIKAEKAKSQNDLYVMWISEEDKHNSDENGSDE